MNTEILIVDDEVLSRDMISDYLEDSGFSSDTADCAKTAVELLGKKEYTIIVTDKNMPGLSESSSEGGMELLKYVKTKHSDIQIIIMTGYATIKTAIESLKYGAFDYLIKPFTGEELIEVIERVLEYKSFINPKNTIQIYKNLHNELIHFLDKGVFDDNEKHEILKELDEKIDIFFKTQKNWEAVILKQRDSLMNISLLAEQLKESYKEISDTEKEKLLNKIIEESLKKI